jgi:hypothetical protein
MDRREPTSTEPVTAGVARAVIAALDARGAWVEPGTIRIALKQRAVQPVIESRTFMRNLHILASYASAAK